MDERITKIEKSLSKRRIVEPNILVQLKLTPAPANKQYANAGVASQHGTPQIPKSILHTAATAGIKHINEQL